MADKRFSLIPASFLVEDDSESLQALFKKHRQALPKSKPSQASGGATSRKSAALSQLAKAFKGADNSKTAKDASSKKSQPKADSAVAKAGAAISKPGASAQKAPLGGRAVGSSAGTAGIRGPGGASAPAHVPIKDPHMDVKHPPGKWAAFEHHAPSLQERAKPDMIPHDERHEDFHERYHSKGATLKKMKYLGSSSSHVFDGEMDDGTRFIAKPHEHPWDARGGKVQADQWTKKHNAVARLLTHMGAGHMIAPAIDTTIHEPGMMPTGHPSIEQAGRKSGYHHAGGKAFVTEFAKDHVNMRDAHGIAHKVDGEHRVMGMITHLLTSNSDGHAGNVLIHKETGHPTLIDHDLSMSLGIERGEIRSQFLPGEAYDYQEKVGQVGKKYPPRVKKTLEWLAGGGHHHKEGGLDLHDNDKASLQRISKLMLKHGLEGAMNKLRASGIHFRG